MFKPILFSLSLLTVVVISCKHEPLSTSTNPNPNTPVIISSDCSPDTVYFVNDILPIMISNCTMSGCHDVASHKEGVILTDYANIVSTADVDAGSPTSSDLYKVLIKSDPDDIMPRPPMSPLTPAQIAMVKKWIEQGAKNNVCMSCDTLGDMKFAMHVTPILQANCTGCHSASSAGGGIDLTAYAGVQAVVANGKLVGAINHTTRFSAMPKNGNKLSECNIVTIQKCIQSGAQNN